MSNIEQLAEWTSLPKSVVAAVLAGREPLTTDEAANVLLDLHATIGHISPGALDDAVSTLQRRGCEKDIEGALREFFSDASLSVAPTAVAVPHSAPTHPQQHSDAVQLTTSDEESVVDVSAPPVQRGGLSYALGVLRGLFGSTAVVPVQKRPWDLVSPIERVSFVHREQAQANYVVVECTSRADPIRSWAIEIMKTGTCRGVTSMQKGEARCAPYITSNEKWHPILCCTEGCVSVDDFRRLYVALSRVLLELSAQSVAIPCLGTRSPSLQVAVSACAQFCFDTPIRVVVSDRRKYVTDVHTALTDLVQRSVSHQQVVTQAIPEAPVSSDFQRFTQTSFSDLPTHNFSEAVVVAAPVPKLPLPSYVFSTSNLAVRSEGVEPLPQYHFSASN